MQGRHWHTYEARFAAVCDRWVASWLEHGTQPHGWRTFDGAPRCAWCGARLTALEAATAKATGAADRHRPVPACRDHVERIASAVQRWREGRQAVGP